VEVVPKLDPEKFVERLISEIKGERKNQELSHEKLATKSGVDRAAISRFESGQRVPGIVTLYKLAAGLEIELSALIERAENS